MTSDDVVNEHVGKQCRVKINFQNGISIERFRKYTSLGGNGVKVKGHCTYRDHLFFCLCKTCYFCMCGCLYVSSQSRYIEMVNGFVTLKPVRFVPPNLALRSCWELILLPSPDP
jgi:hypothetical protein